MSQKQNDEIEHWLMQNIYKHIEYLIISIDKNMSTFVS